MCEANVDAPSHVAKPSTNRQMTAPLHGIAHKRVSIERHRVVVTSQRCDVPRGSSHVRGRRQLALGLLSFTSTSVQAGDELRTPWRKQPYQGAELESLRALESATRAALEA
jgi:hypothetical protein